ncbi:hypothetical protein BDW74DRAFT_183117 [Aspergillus multicolor]|uniref:oxidase ustYa family protein n=1 Tax=Aspergillus multicolor TaxID=41759 RepID=UPI003CCE513C
MCGNIQFHLSLGASAALLLASSALLLDAITFSPNDAQCDAQMSPWTPARAAIKYDWTMFPPIHFLAHSLYFDSPLPEREAAWRELLPPHPIAIPASHLPNLNLTTDTGLEPESASEYEFISSPNTPTSLLALPEVFVQLHCLNLLRLHGQRDEIPNGTYDLPSFQGTEEQVSQRVEQCLDRLRTTFLCWSDIAPILMYFEDGDREARRAKKYDFGTRHRCRDFGALRDWTRENGVEGVVMGDAWWGGSL